MGSRFLKSVRAFASRFTSSKPAARPSDRRRRLLCEPLEDRRLLTASLNLAGGNSILQFAYTDNLAADLPSIVGSDGNLAFSATGGVTIANAAIIGTTSVNTATITAFPATVTTIEVIGPGGGSETLQVLAGGLNVAEKLQIDNTVHQAVFAGAVTAAGIAVNTPIDLNGGTAATSAFGQTYNQPVVLSADTVLADNAAQNIVFNSTVDSFDAAAANAHSLTVNTKGATQFNGSVGGLHPLSGLTTNAAGAPAAQAGGTTSLGGSSYIVASPAYAFQDISSTGTAVSFVTLDDSSTQITPAGMTFPFYGQNYTSMFVSTNGLITFGSGNNAFINTNLSSSPAQATIAAFWDDLQVQGTASTKVLYQVVGSGAGAHLVVQWNNLSYFLDSSYLGGLTFEAVLGADGTIRLNYQSLATGRNGGGNDLGVHATVGIKDVNGSTKPTVLASYNTAMSNNSSLLFSPPGASVTTVNNGGAATGAQNFGNPLQLQGNTVLTSNFAAPATTGGNIALGTLSGAFTLQANTTGNTIVGGAVSGGGLLVNDPGGAATDAINLSSDGTNYYLKDTANYLAITTGGTEVDTHNLAVPLSSFGATDYIWLKSLVANTTFTVDFTNQNPVPGGSVNYNGNGTNSKLVLAGGTFDRDIYAYGGPHSGSVTRILGANSYIISYSGLTPLTNTGTVADATFFLPGVLTAAVLADSGSTPDNLKLTGGTFEDTTFAAPTHSLEIRRGIAANTLTTNIVTSLTAGLTVGNSVEPFAAFTENNPLALTTGAGNLEVHAATINLNGGGTAVATLNGQKYDGNVVLGADTTLVSMAGTPSPAGDITFLGTVLTDGTPRDLTVNTALGVEFQADVGNAAGKELGSLTTSSAGTAQLGAAAAFTVTTKAAGGKTGNQDYKGNVVVAADTTVNAANATFEKIVWTYYGLPRDLAVVAAAGVTFLGNVGTGGRQLGSLTVTSGGPTQLGAGVGISIITQAAGGKTGNQDYKGDVQLGADTAIFAYQSSGGSPVYPDVIFEKTVSSQASGYWGLRVAAPGVTWFQGDVGNFAANTQLGYLQTDAGATLPVNPAQQTRLGNGGAVKVYTRYFNAGHSGDQDFGHAVVLYANTQATRFDGPGGPVALPSGDIHFRASVDSRAAFSYGLEANSYSNEVFDGLVGNAAGGKLGYLWTDLYTGTGGTIGGSATFNIDASTASAGNGGVNIDATSQPAGTIALHVGDMATLNVANSTLAAPYHPSVLTTANALSGQQYDGAVLLQQDTVLSDNRGNASFGNIVFLAALDAAIPARGLAVSTFRDEVFNGLVGNTGKLGYLWTDVDANLTVGGASCFNMNAGAAAAGNAGVNIDATGQPAGTVALHLGDTVVLNISNSTYTGAYHPSILTKANALSGQQYDAGVWLFQDTVLSDANTTRDINGNAPVGNILFAGTIDSSSATYHGLAVSTLRDEVFNGIVGQWNPLAYLATDVDATALSTGVGGTACFNMNAGANPVAGRGGVNIDATGRANQVDLKVGDNALVNIAGSSTAHPSVWTNGTTTAAEINGQQYNGAMWLNGNTVFQDANGGDIAFAGTIDSLTATLADLTVLATPTAVAGVQNGRVSFGNLVGIGRPLNSLTVAAGGPMVVATFILTKNDTDISVRRSIDTTGAFDQLTVAPSVILASQLGKITLRATDSLTLDAAAVGTTYTRSILFATQVNLKIGYYAADTTASGIDVKSNATSASHNGAGYVKGQIVTAGTQVQAVGGANNDALWVYLQTILPYPSGATLLPAVGLPANGLPAAGLSFDGGANVAGKADTLRVEGTGGNDLFCVDEPTSTILHGYTAGAARDAKLVYTNVEKIQIDGTGGNVATTFQCASPAPAPAHQFWFDGGTGTNSTLKVVGGGSDSFAVGNIPAVYQNQDMLANITLPGDVAFTRAPVQPLPGMALPQRFAVKNLSRMQVLGGNGGDVLVNNTAIAALMVGGTGNDVIVGGLGASEEVGGAGSDKLYGRGTVDYVLANYTYNPATGKLSATAQTIPQYVYDWPSVSGAVLCQNTSPDTDPVRVVLPSGSGLGLTTPQWLRAIFRNPADILATAQAAAVTGVLPGCPT